MLRASPQGAAGFEIEDGSKVMQAATELKRFAAVHLAQLALAIGIICALAVGIGALVIAIHSPSADDAPSTVVQWVGSAANERDRAGQIAQYRAGSMEQTIDGGPTADRAAAIAALQTTATATSDTVDTGNDRAAAIAELTDSAPVSGFEPAELRAEWFRLVHRYWTTEAQARLHTTQ